MKLVEGGRVLVRFNDMSVFAGYVKEVQVNGITIEIEQTHEFPKGSVVFLPFTSIKYIHIQ